jgi:hypothetical protein
VSVCTVCVSVCLLAEAVMGGGGEVPPSLGASLASLTVSLTSLSEEPEPRASLSVRTKSF